MLFPGREDPKSIVDMQTTHTIHWSNGSKQDACNQPSWHTCLTNKCKKHEEEKNHNGFSDEQTFLGQRHESQRPPGKSTN
jgi:hypothetical protein